MNYSANLRPGKAPYATFGLIYNTDGSLVLSVARQDNILRLPGGTLSNKDTFSEALVRGVRRETGLEVLRMTPFFGDYSTIMDTREPGEEEEKQSSRQESWCLVYLCKVTGKIEPRERDRLFWVSPPRLFYDEYGIIQTFGMFHETLLESLKASRLPVEQYRSKVEVEEAHILRLSWDDSHFYTAY